MSLVVIEPCGLPCFDNRIIDGVFFGARLEMNSSRN